MGSSGCGLHGIHAQRHHAVPYFHWKCTDLRSSLDTRFDYEASLQANAPVMQPAGDGGINHRPIGQRIARMRAAILERQVAVAHIEYRDGQISNAQLAALAGRNGLSWCYLNPLHDANLLGRPRLLSLNCNTGPRHALTARMGANGIVRATPRDAETFVLAASAVLRTHVRLMPH